MPPTEPPAASSLIHRMGYRPALDGVRAAAILAVMAQHTGVRELRGGGVGVDLFFALSGLLITKLLLEELEQRGRVSLRKFYIRRALRLLPPSPSSSPP